MGFPSTRLRLRLLLCLTLTTLTAVGGCRQAPWPLWDSYAGRFIDVQGRVIDPQGDGRTTSEGQAYALFFALADNDRTRFDLVLSWTQSNLAAGDLATHLPAWLWGKDKDGSWRTLDPNPASDADTWIAFSLVEAGRLWKAPAYTATGRSMMHMIAISEVADLPGFGKMLLPGPIGFKHDRSFTLNPSYLPLFLFERWAVIDPAGPWQQVALNIPKLLRQSSVHGYPMDWVQYVPGDGFYPATPHPEKDSPAPVGSYDAIRVYLWVGITEPSSPLRAEILSAVPSMGVYLASHDDPPEKVSNQGIPLEQSGPTGFTAALIPYLRAYPGLVKTSSMLIIRLARQKDAASGLYGKDLTYYDQNLALFSTGFTEGKFRFGPGGELRVEWSRP